MKNKNVFLFFITVSFCFYFGNAQLELNASDKEVLKEKVIKNAEKTESIVCGFSQKKQLSILNDAIISEGKLVFKAPNSVKWEYIKPYQNIAIFKNNKLYVNNQGNKDEIDLSRNKLFKSLNMLIVNSIKGDMFDDEQFEISYFNSEDGYLVKFIPKEKRLKKFIARFELRFSKITTEVEEVKLIEPNEDFTLITFKNKKLNSPVKDDEFNL